MAKDDQRIPDEAGDHHTWKTAAPKKYTGQHRASDKDKKSDNKDKK